MLQVTCTISDEETGDTLVNLYADDDVKVHIIAPETDEKMDMTWKQAMALKDLLVLAENAGLYPPGM